MGSVIVPSCLALMTNIIVLKIIFVNNLSVALTVAGWRKHVCWPDAKEWQLGHERCSLRPAKQVFLPQAESARQEPDCVKTLAKRTFWLVFGAIALGLGVLGIFLPLLPTTPFVLLAAFAFARSSDRLHQWLLEHEIFGALIADWQKYGAISKGAKISSIASMIAVIGISLLLSAPGYVMLVQIVVLTISATFILTRPLPPR